jgi:competence protein ComEC
MPERVRHDIGTFLDKNLKPKSAGLYRALLIGSRSGISQATLEQYKATGCMHLLAISGVHMGLLGMMISLGLAWLMKRSRYLLLHTHIPTLATLLTLLPLVGYAFIAGLNTPVLRALVMAVFFLIVVVLKRQKSILHIIAAAALIVLIFKPLALFTVSFQLSFSAVLAIALIYPRLVSLLDQKQLSPGKKLYTYICAALFVSIAATLGSLPFMLLHFNRFSTIGPFMNLLIEPLLCLWSLPIGLLAMPLIYISPDIAAALLKVGTVGILAADRITLVGSTFPFASLWSITPNNGEIILFYGLLLLWIYRSKTAYRKLSLLSVSALFLLFFTRGLWFTLPGKISEITFLDIGQGTSTLIELPHGGTVLLDGGSKASPHFDVGERIIAPFLWKKQLWQIDDVIITHPHSDHFNGLSFIFSHFRPKRVWVNGSSSESNQYRDLLRLASKKNIPIHIPEPGQRLVTEKRAEIICLNGGERNHINSSSAGKPDNFTLNDLSLIIKFEHGNSSFLFPGDISKKMEYSLIDQGTDLKAEVLLAPHHGSKGSGSRRFISAVNPDLIVISAGQNGRGQYLDPGHLKQWQKDERKVLITSRNGTVTCWSDGTDLHVKTIYGRALVIKPR